MKFNALTIRRAEGVMVAGVIVLVLVPRNKSHVNIRPHRLREERYGQSLSPDRAVG